MRKEQDRSESENISKSFFINSASSLSSLQQQQWPVYQWQMCWYRKREEKVQDGVKWQNYWENLAQTREQWRGKWKIAVEFKAYFKTRRWKIMLSATVESFTQCKMICKTSQNVYFHYTEEKTTRKTWNYFTTSAAHNSVAGFGPFTTSISRRWCSLSTWIIGVYTQTLNSKCY